MSISNAWLCPCPGPCPCPCNIDRSRGGWCMCTRPAACRPSVAGQSCNALFRLVVPQHSLPENPVHSSLHRPNSLSATSCRHASLTSRILRGLHDRDVLSGTLHLRLLHPWSHHHEHERHDAEAANGASDRNAGDGARAEAVIISLCDRLRHGHCSDDIG